MFGVPDECVLAKEVWLKASNRPLAFVDDILERDDPFKDGTLFLFPFNVYQNNTLTGGN